MEFSVLQDNLKTALSTVSRVVASKPSLPVLSNIYLEAKDNRLVVRATNLGTTIETYIGANVTTEGAYTVPAKTFVDLIASLPADRLDMQLDEMRGWLEIKQGKRTSTIKGIDASEFPRFEFDTDSSYEFNSLKLKQALSRTLFAAATEDNRPILTGLHLAVDESGCAKLITADGYRVAIQQLQLDTPIDTAFSLVIPCSAMTEVQRIINTDEPTFLAVNEGTAWFVNGATTIASQTIDGKYPDAEQLLPKTSKTTLQVFTSEFSQAAKYASVFARDAANVLDMEIQAAETALLPATLTLKAKSLERGNNSWGIDVKLDGAPINISMNVENVKQWLGVVGSEQVEVRVIDAKNPIVFVPVNDPDHIYMVMPMSGRGN